jgi:hypothetical protein
MVVTAPSRERLRRWFAAGRPMPSADTVVVTGDTSLEPLVRRVLERLPAPALDHLRRNAIVLPVGRGGSGFCAQLPGPSADAGEARRLLVCEWSGDDAGFESTVAHESAHHWLIEAAAEDLPPRTDEEVLEQREDRARLISCAREWGLVSHLTDRAARVEREACALAETWGFRQHVELCVQGAHDCIRQEAAALDGKGA